MIDRFVLALERAIARIERHPSIGSPRYAHELDIPLLRYWSVTKFPYANSIVPAILFSHPAMRGLARIRSTAV